MIKLSIVDNYLKFSEVRSRTSVCREFQKWFKEHYDSFDLACDHLRSVQPMVSSLANWNDAPERTHAEVLARFDEAIAKLEEKVC